MAYVLKSARGKKQGLAIPIRTKVFLIGSSPKSQIRSCKPGVGRRHCALFLRRKQLYLQDLESGYPTRVNGLTITAGARLVLRMGDHVAMGPMEFIIEERHRKKKPAVMVAAPYAAPPVPVGKPAVPVAARPVPVPVTAALASPLAIPVRSPSLSQRPPSKVWSMVALAALAMFGLGGGVMISRGLLGSQGEEKPAKHDGEKKSGEEQVVRNDIRQDDPKRDKGMQGDPNKDLQGQNKDGKPVQEPKKPDSVIKKPDPEIKKPDPEIKKPDPEPKKPDPEPKKPDPEPKKPDPEPKKPDPDPTKTGPRVAYASHVQPILVERCTSCHGGAKKKGGLDLSTIEAMLKGGETGPAIVAGDAEKSPLWMRVDDGSMPPAGKPLTSAQKKALQDWIVGAANGGFAR